MLAHHFAHYHSRLEGDADGWCLKWLAGVMSPIARLLMCMLVGVKAYFVHVGPCGRPGPTRRPHPLQAHDYPQQQLMHELHRLTDWLPTPTALPILFGHLGPAPLLPTPNPQHITHMTRSGSWWIYRVPDLTRPSCLHQFAPSLPLPYYLLNARSSGQYICVRYIYIEREEMSQSSMSMQYWLAMHIAWHL
jgi:hypothetical protein